MSDEKYMVSALKYRPQSWDSIVGQHNIAKTLQQAIQSDHLAQAYLFCGPRGVGKTSTARLFAKAINLKHDEKLQDFSYNIYELDAASNNQVDDIRNLNDQVRIPPQKGKYKVYIIDEVHMLSQSAFNAFLKTLEEPPPHAVFILATTEKHKIIPTILSRCQVYDFHRISILDIVDHLENIAKKEDVKIEKEALHVIAEKADGALRDALSCFDLMVNFCEGDITYKKVIQNLNILDHDYYFNLIDLVLENKIHESLLLFAEILSKGFDGKLFISGLATHLRNLMMSKDERTLQILEYSSELKGKFSEQATRIDPDDITTMLTLLSESETSYKSSQNQRLLIEITLMQLCSVQIQKKKAKSVAILPPNFLDIEEIGPLPKNDQNKKTDIKLKKQHESPELEVEEPKIIAPKRSLSIKKRSLTTSISGIRKKLNDKEEQVQKQEELLINSNSKFSSHLLIEKWNKFAEIKKKEGKMGLHTTLTKSSPILKNDFNVDFHLDSEVQKMDLQKETPYLLEYLRKELNNGSIQIHLHVSEMENQKISQFTSRERFFQMAEKNPDLHLFKEEFDLDLEY
ncbi:MAG: DNA polymerase III subunit gamma/tau [Bacteroidota bacterium]|nr:DNA polymerase III subunit gamma/tau [Bacteroidota bacterium]